MCIYIWRRATTYCQIHGGYLGRVYPRVYPVYIYSSGELFFGGLPRRVYPNKLVMTSQACDHECLAYNQPAWLCRAVLGCAWLCLAMPGCACLCLAAPGCAGGPSRSRSSGIPLPGDLEVVFGYTQGIPSPQKNLPTVFRLGWGPGVLASIVSRGLPMVAITRIAVLRVAFQGVAA